MNVAHNRALSIAFAALLLFSVISVLPDANALSGVTFTTKATATSVSTSQWQRAYENGTNSIIFLDGDASGNIKQAKYAIATESMTSTTAQLTTSTAFITPSSASASSYKLGTASFTDNYSSTSGWTQTGASSGGIAVTGGAATADAWQGGSAANQRSLYKSLGVTLSNSRWIADIEYRFTAEAAGGTFYILALTAGTGWHGDTNISQDGIAASHNKNPDGTNCLKIISQDGTSVAGSAGCINISASTTYYLRLERTSSTETTLSVFTDSNRLTHASGSPITFTIPSTVTGLATLMHINQIGDGTGNTLTATLDNVAVYDSSAATEWQPSNTIDSNASTEWQNAVSSESGAYIYFDMNAAKSVAAIRIAHTSGTNIPQSIDIYISNSTSSWGSVHATITLTQSSGSQSYTFTAKTGQFIKWQVNTWGTATTWRINEAKVGIGASANAQVYNSAIESSGSTLTHFAVGRDTGTGTNLYAAVTTGTIAIGSNIGESSSLTPKDIVQSKTKIYVALIDGSNNLSLGIMSRDFTGYSEVSLGDAMLSGGFVHMTVYDGSPDTVYVYYSDSTTVIKVAKYTSSASILGTTMTQASNADFAVEQLTNKVLVQSNNRFYEHVISGDVITQVYANTFATYYPQAFSLSGDDLAIDFGSPNTSKYLQAASNTVYDVTTEDFWIAGMFKRTSDSGGTETITRKFTGTGYSVVVDGSDFLSANIIDASGVTDITLSSVTVSLNVWYAWGVSHDRDGNGTVFLYNLNTGTLSTASANISTRSGTLANTATFTVGRLSEVAAGFFPGQMDNLIPPQIGQTLTQADFLAFAQSGTLPPGTANLYEFKNNTNDALGSNNLTTNGSPTFTTRVAGSRTYSSNAIYVANSTYATNYTPNTGSSARTGVIVDSADSGTGTLSAYDPAKYYILNGNAVAVDAASAGATSWNVKTMGTRNQVNITPYSERLNVPLVQNTTLLAEDVIRMVCDAAYHIDAAWQQYMAIGDDSDCASWRMVAESSATVGRELQPYSRTPSPVHTDSFTGYSFQINAADPTIYRIISIYDGKTVDTAQFDSSGQQQQRYLYGQCYTLQVTNTNTGANALAGNVCANDFTTKSININTIAIPVNWQGFTWAWNVNRDFTNSTNNQLVFTFDKSTYPYNANVHFVDNILGAPTFDQWYNFTNLNAQQTITVTGIFSNQTIYITTYENGVSVIRTTVTGQSLTLTNFLAPLGNIFGISAMAFLVVFVAGIFPRSAANVGMIGVLATTGVLFALGWLPDMNPLFWPAMLGLAAVGLFAHRK